MAGFVYGGKFEQIINEMLGPENIAASATKFKDLEKQYGPYSFGKFVKYFLPKPEEFANWDKDAGGISEPVEPDVADTHRKERRRVSFERGRQRQVCAARVHREFQDVGRRRRRAAGADCHGRATERSHASR